MYPVEEVTRTEYFKKVKAHLLKPGNRKKFVLTREWCKSFSDKAGVYLIFREDKLIYVGETGHLRKRMYDLLNTKNHCLRRSCGEHLFSKHKNYIKASSSISFPVEIEDLLNKWIEANLYISCLPLNLGRKEFEEWIFSTTPVGQLLNKRSQRT